MGTNPVGGWVSGSILSSRLPGWTAAIALSIVSSTSVAYGNGNPMPPDETRTPTVAQIVPMPRFDRSILRVGSQGEEVSEIQGILKLLGFYRGIVNGVYDSPTSQAVSRFQQAAGVNPDGIVGMDTWNQLLPSAVSPIVLPATTPCNCNSGSIVATTSLGDLPILQFGSRGTAVSALQRRLQTQGFFSGIIDGIFGSQTEEAVRSAQLNYSLDANGVVDSRLWEVLLR
ncbi:MAG: peptidoglycan-binding protein [Geitlerinemataceae cyanobacterium]